jgi:hypothetical protein
MLAVVVFGFVFNCSRWFELETVVVNATDSGNGNETGNEASFRVVLRNTELRRNPAYIKYYSLMGSTVVMVFVPVVILIVACISMHKAIPAGNQVVRLFASTRSSRKKRLFAFQIRAGLPDVLFSYQKSIFG